MKGIFKFSIRDMAEIAIMSALAIAFDTFTNIKLHPNGGSISIACLPLFIVAIRHGWFKGFIASGVVFGLTTCLLDGHGFHLFVFDYLFAFGCIGLAGLFGRPICKLIKSEQKKDKVFALLLMLLVVTIYFVVRIFSSSVNSMIFYHYTLGASLIYNMSYTGPSALAVLIFLYLLSPVLIAINNQYPSEFLKDTKKEIVEETKED